MATSKQYENSLPLGYRLQGGKHVYVIEEILGRGGFGITYKVKTQLFVDNISVDVHFAIKEYFPDICWRDENNNTTMIVPKTKNEEIQNGIRDFINEGRRLQDVCHLNHNIVNVNEVFEANGTAYYVLEYLEGGDLCKLLKDNGKPFTEQQMLAVMTPIGQAVQCLHDNNILHLDIKPSNIVMRRNHDCGDDEPVLIDFGIAVHFNNSGTPTSKTPSLGVSPGYSPIEQYSGIRQFDPRLDVYAFGATCLYLISGKDPIEALNIPSGFVKSTIPDGVSYNVANAIVRAMSKENEYRTSSINEFFENLITKKEFAAEDGDDERTVDNVELAYGEDKNYTRLSGDYDENMHDYEDAGNGKKKIIVIISSVLAAAAIIAGIIFGMKGCAGEKNHANNTEAESVSAEDGVLTDSADVISEAVKDSRALCDHALKLFKNAQTKEDIQIIEEAIEKEYMSYLEKYKGISMEDYKSVDSIFNEEFKKRAKPVLREMRDKYGCQDEFTKSMRLEQLDSI